jgi:hypothetical protein
MHVKGQAVFWVSEFGYKKRTRVRCASVGKYNTSLQLKKPPPKTSINCHPAQLLLPQLANSHKQILASPQNHPESPQKPFSPWPAMANPSYYKTSAPVRSQVQHQEHLFHLYAFQQLGTNEFNIVPEKTGLPNFFGRTNVMDWDVHDAPDTKAAVVAQLQGLAIAARRSTQSWYSSFNVVFTDERFVSFLCWPFKFLYILMH